MELKEKIKALKERLKDPFDYEGLENEFIELEKMMREASPETLKEIAKDYEDVKNLIRRNLEIFAKLYGVR